MTPAGATLLLVFGLGADKDEYELRIYDPADWQMVGWFRDQLAPSEFAVDRDNFGVQLRCVTGLATQSGPLPEGARLKDGRWTSLALCGWDSISGVKATPRWSHVTVDNTIGPISYPAGLVSEDVRLPDIRLSLGG